MTANVYQFIKLVWIVLQLLKYNLDHNKIICLKLTKLSECKCTNLGINIFYSKS